MDLSARIRERRLALGLTLEGLAERTGVSRAMLSDIERGRKNPTVKLLAAIAEGLGCTVSALLGEDGGAPAEAITVVRRDERRRLVDPRSGVERHVLAPALLQRGVEVIWYEIPPGQDPYEGALARARCEHPDMLVHPRAWLVRRVPSPPMVARFALDRAETHVTECVYEVDRAGRVRRVR